MSPESARQDLFDIITERFSINVAPGIEYNIYPHAESSRRQFTFTYEVAASHYRYLETTIFSKNSEFTSVSVLPSDPSSTTSSILVSRDRGEASADISERSDRHIDGEIKRGYVERIFLLNTSVSEDVQVAQSRPGTLEPPPEASFRMPFGTRLQCRAGWARSSTL